MLDHRLGRAVEAPGADPVLGQRVGRAVGLLVGGIALSARALNVVLALDRVLVAAQDDLQLVARLLVGLGDMDALIGVRRPVERVATTVASACPAPSAACRGRRRNTSSRG